MHITLTARHIDAVLSDVEHGLTQYLWVQNRFRQVDVRIDAEFQRAFNSFYRVRRNRRWREEFFRLLESGKERSLTFGEALDHLVRRGECCRLGHLRIGRVSSEARNVVAHGTGEQLNILGQVAERGAELVRIVMAQIVAIESHASLRRRRRTHKRTRERGFARAR